MSRNIWLSFVVAMALLSAGCTNPETPAGHEGYVFERPRIIGKGGFRGIVKGPGNYGVSVFRNEVINIDTRPKTYTEQFEILAKDDLNIAFRFHVIIGLVENRVEDVVVKYGGEDWFARFVREPFRTFVRSAVQQYDSREVKANRELVASQVEAQLQVHLDGTPFELVSLVVGNIDYPESVAKAVEAKLAAKQLLEEKETQKLIAQRDAEIRIEEAKGIAEAQRIINATLTPNYLQHEAIQAQEEMAASPNHTTVYIPVGTNGLPLVHMPKN
jgi:regulator of protease activity HflC (stomatin/prohibitin superfamily)